MSELRSAAPQRCRVATVKYRAARTDPGSAPSRRVAIRGGDARPAGTGSGAGRRSPFISEAISAAIISQWRPGPAVRCDGCAVIAVWSISSRHAYGRVRSWSMAPWAALLAWRGCRLAAARLPSSDRTPRPGCASHRSDWVLSESASGHGLSVRDIMVRFALRPDGQGRKPAGSTAVVMAGSPGHAVGGASPDSAAPRDALAMAIYRSHGTTGRDAQKRGSVCWQRGQASRPRASIRHPAPIAQGPGIGLAKRGQIGIPGDARTDFAPHDRHPQLIADHSPPGFPGAGVGPGVGARRVPRHQPEHRRGPRCGHRPERGLLGGDGRGRPLRRGHRRAARHSYRRGAGQASRPPPSGASRVPEEC